MDLRIENIFNQEMINDTSFNEKEGFFKSLFSKNITNKDLKEAWNNGIKHGIEIGLRRASLEGQIVEISNNTTNEEHKEFLNEFFKLTNKYNCFIKYHPILGMIIISK